MPRLRSAILRANKEIFTRSFPTLLMSKQEFQNYQTNTHCLSIEPPKIVSEEKMRE